MKNFGTYLHEINRYLEFAYNQGYSYGKAAAKEEYGKEKGIAHCEKATEEEREKYGIELWGWCDCGKPIEGRWVGNANFCPWCGKIIEWKKESKNEVAF